MTLNISISSMVSVIFNLVVKFTHRFFYFSLFYSHSIITVQTLTACINILLQKIGILLLFLLLLLCYIIIILLNYLQIFVEWIISLSLLMWLISNTVTDTFIPWCLSTLLDKTWFHCSVFCFVFDLYWLKIRREFNGCC